MNEDISNIINLFKPRRLVGRQEYISPTVKLKMTWTPEMAQDLMAYYTIDAEAELTRILEEEILKEFLKQTENV